MWDGIKDENRIGECDPPTKPNKEIRVRSTLSKEETLEIWIHEMLHACHWDLAEEAISETAEDIAQALIKLGYRLNDKD